LNSVLFGSLGMPKKISFVLRFWI